MCTVKLFFFFTDDSNPFRAYGLSHCTFSIALTMPESYDGILLSLTCKMMYVHMQLNYIHMRLFYVQHVHCKIVMITCNII